MTDGETTYASLIDFGIDPVTAREASRRYVGNVEAAADWCFGAGSDVHKLIAQWKPPAAPVDNPPKYGGGQHARVEHHEVMDHQSSSRPPSSPRPRTPPPLPARRQGAGSTPGPSRPILGSNNPFAATASATAASAVAPPPPELPSDPWGDDEDVELQRAIRMSQGDIPDDGGTGQDTEMTERGDRERSVRATAPPPSPDPERLRSVEEEGQVLGILFGPSAKEEEGATAMVSFSEGATDKPSKEDEDLNRAIQDSLMTASFHSASALPVEKPSARMREPGAPLVFLSESGGSTYAAHFLQAMYAVPQLREAVMRSAAAFDELEMSGRPGLAALQKIFGAGLSDPLSFIDVDGAVADIRQKLVGQQLPPQPPAMDLVNTFSRTIHTAVADAVAIAPALRENGPLWEDPTLLMNSTLHPALPDGPAHHVKLVRSSDMPYRVSPSLAGVLWGYDAPLQSIEELGEVLCVFISWGYGAPRKLWELEQRIVLDRFMKGNLTWATQIRAQEGMAKANARRIKEKLEHLTTFQEELTRRGTNFQESIATIIKHYDLTPSSASTEDEITEKTRVELRAKLQRNLDLLRSKTDELQSSLQTEEDAANGSLFETAEPHYNQHVYTLRALLMHDGALIAGKHLYAYVMDDNGGWWKIEEHECTRVEWDAISKDQTGLYMEGGPYCLVYAREGARPPRIPRPIIPRPTKTPARRLPRMARPPLADQDDGDTASAGIQPSNGDDQDATMDDTRSQGDNGAFAAVDAPTSAVAADQLHPLEATVKQDARKPSAGGTGTDGGSAKRGSQSSFADWPPVLPF